MNKEKQKINWKFVFTIAVPISIVLSIMLSIIFYKVSYKYSGLARYEKEQERKREVLATNENQ